MTDIDDADLGPIKVPPPPTRADAEKLIEEQREAMAIGRIWPDGSVTKCPACGQRSLVGRSDLSHEVAGEGAIVIFRHLHGAKCARCDSQVLEPAEQIQIERDVGLGGVGNYEAKVSNIGSGTVGTYWPKDVVRVMRLEPHTRVYIQVLDRETALVRFVRGRRNVTAKKKERSAPTKRKQARKTSKRAG